MPRDAVSRTANVGTRYPAPRLIYSSSLVASDAFRVSVCAQFSFICYIAISVLFLIYCNFLFHMLQFLFFFTCCNFFIFIYVAIYVLFVVYYSSRYCRLHAQLRTSRFPSYLLFTLLLYFLLIYYLPWFTLPNCPSTHTQASLYK